jgi:RNA polymerase sigma-70 factor (ECF subfamily)
LADDEYAVIRAQLARAVQRHCPRWLSADADDIVQAAMMRVLTGRRSREESGPPPASYVWKVAYSAMIDEIRRRRRRREAPLEDQRAEALPAAGGDPEQAAAAGQIGERIESCLGALERSRRLAVTLHLQGHSLRETAGLLGWDEKRAQNLVYRGLAELRKCLASAGVKP